GRRPRDAHGHRALELVRLRIVHDADMDSGGAVVVGDALRVDHLPHAPRLDTAQADVRAAHRRYAPREAPAVAMEHRQGPEVAGVEAHLRLDHLAERVDPGTAVRVHDALGPAGRAGGVVDGE